LGDRVLGEVIDWAIVLMINDYCQKRLKKLNVATFVVTFKKDA
jgi:hypothetical protein